ncbi:MAG: cell division topological specificity factor MinE [Aeromonas sp.]
MSLLDYFRSEAKPQTSARLAKERLQIIVAHERGAGAGPDYLPELKRDILEVVRRYVAITSDNITVQLEQRTEELSVLELNITLPDDKKS